MSDLTCKLCGWSMSYADASISDSHRECPNAFDGLHDWEETHQWDDTREHTSQIPDMSELSKLTDMSQKDIEELSCQMLEIMEDCDV